MGVVTRSKTHLGAAARTRHKQAPPKRLSKRVLMVAPSTKGGRYRVRRAKPFHDPSLIGSRAHLTNVALLKSSQRRSTENRPVSGTRASPWPCIENFKISGSGKQEFALRQRPEITSGQFSLGSSLAISCALAERVAVISSHSAARLVTAHHAHIYRLPCPPTRCAAWSWPRSRRH